MTKVYSYDGEHYYDEFSTINDFHECIPVGEVVNVYEGTRKVIRPSNLLGKYVVSELLENMTDVLYDLVGEYADGNPYCSERNTQEFDKSLRELADKYCSINCWGVDNTREVEYVMTEDGLEVSSG